MATSEVTPERPGSPEEAAALLRSLGGGGTCRAPVGGRTKLDWGGVGEPIAVELETGGMAKILEHNEGDLTAVLQAGVPLAEAQATVRRGRARCSRSTRRWARATPRRSAGCVATGDSGPLRHRYGGVRDLVLGISVALSDGTWRRPARKVIKNVAGYDLGKLFAGSYGTLGLILDGHRAAAPEARRHRHRGRRERRRRRAAARRGRARRAPAGGRLARRRLAGQVGPRARALRRRERGRPGRGHREAHAGGRPGQACRRWRTTKTSGPRSRNAQRSPEGAVLKVSGRVDRPRPRHPRDRAGRRLARLARGPRAVVDRARQRRPRAPGHRGPRRARAAPGRPARRPGRAAQQTSTPGARSSRERSRSCAGSRSASTPTASSGPAPTWEASDGPRRGRLGRAPPARPGADQGLRALRLLPADVPELPELRGRDGLAARAASC